MKRKRKGSKNCENDLKNGINSCLTLDILFSILVRIPVEDLLEAKRVCRLWYNLITGCEFPRAHLEYWKSRAEIIVYNKYEFVYNSFNVRTMRTHQLCLGNRMIEKVKVVDSLDGLVLFSVTGYRKRLYICNPITKKFKFLLYIPASWCREAQPYYKLVFDPAQKKYKVFGFCYRLPHHSIDNMYCVLTLNFDEDGQRCSRRGFIAPCWRNVEHQFLHRSEFEFISVAIGRVLYWIAHAIDRILFVQSMDIVEDMFKGRITLPCQPNTWRHGTCGLLEMEMGGSLHVAILDADFELGIWCLKDQGECDWIKQHIINCNSGLSFIRVFCFNFQVLQAVDNHDSNLMKLIIKYNDMLWSFNFKSQEFTLLRQSCGVCSFVPSLISWN